MPKLVRKRPRIQSGGRLLVDVQDGLMLLMPQPRCYTDTLASLHREIWERVDVQRMVDEERGAWDESRKD